MISEHALKELSSLSVLSTTTRAEDLMTFGTDARSFALCRTRLLSGHIGRDFQNLSAGEPGTIPGDPRGRERKSGGACQ